MKVVFRPEYQEAIVNKTEIWVSLESLGYSLYEISSFSQVRDNKGNILNESLQHGYSRVSLITENEEGKRKFQMRMLHQLLVDTFLIKPGSPKKLTVDHIDRNPQNNDISNLRWATATQQNLNRVTTDPKGIPVNQYEIDGTFVRRWSSVKEILASNPSLNVNGLRGNLNGYSTSNRGYVWKYEKTDLSEEEWKDHPELGVEISDKGRVRKKNGVPTIGNSRNGEYVITIEYKKYLVARLVAETFHGLHQNQMVIHVDGNKKNNAKENVKFAGVTKTYIRPNSEANLPKVRLSPVIQIDRNTREIIAYFDSAQEAAKSLHMQYSGIKSVCNRTRKINGGGKYCGGFKWRYADHLSYQEKLEIFQQPNKKRKMIDSDNEKDETTLKKMKYSK